MPTCPPPRSAGSLSRRTAVGGLAALAATAVSGCTPRGVDRRPEPRPAVPSTTTSPDVDPDVALAARVLADEQEMLERVLATVERHPRLGRVLARPRAVHRAHIDLLTEAVPDDARTSSPASASTPDAGPGSPTESVTASPSSSAAGSASPASSPSVSPSVPAAGAAPRVPDSQRAALATLARAEDRMGLLGKRSAFAAQSGAFARVLASMAAAAAQQSATLTEAAAERAHR